MREIRYLATYQGPSYGGFGDSEWMEGFYSIGAAKAAMHSRQQGRDYVMQYRANADGAYVLWEHVAVRDFPATTKDDFMDLYVVKSGTHGQVYIGSGVPDVRLSVGVRGGIIEEKG